MLMLARRTPDPDPNDPYQMLTFREVQRKTRLGETKIRDLIGSGKFPGYIKIGDRCYFRQWQVDEWIAAQFPSE